MAKSKLDLKGFFLKKGEKVMLGAAALLMVVFGGMGVMTALESGDPESQARELTSSAQRIRTAMGDESARPDPLPKWLNQPLRFEEVSHLDHQVANLYFAPNISGSTQRVNPKILGPEEFQAEMVRAKVLAYEMVFDQQSGAAKIAVRVAAKEDMKPDQIKALRNLAKGLDRRSKAADEIRQQIIRIQQREAAMMGAMLGGGGGGEEGGGFGGAGFGGFGGGEEGYPAGGGEEGYNPNVTRSDVRYMPLEDVVDNPPGPFGLTILPKRMVVVNAAFPYKKQLEEFRKALRLDSSEQVMAQFPPYFEGFEVQRRVRFTNDDEWSDWVAFDYEKDYRDNIFPRMVMPQPENPELTPVLLHPAYKLVLPLPGLANGKYPEVELEKIEKTLEDIRNRTKLPEVPSDFSKKFKGDGDIWNAFGGMGGGMGGRGFGPGAGGEGSPDDPYGFGGYPGGFGGMGFPGSEDGYEGGGNYYSNQFGSEAQEYVLMRFLDSAVLPGREYQYRVRVRVSNPNFGQDQLVSRPSLAKIETLEGEWVEMTETVEIPREHFLYAVAPSEDWQKHMGENEALVQVQAWREAVRPAGSSAREPVGEWVVTNFAVKAGEPIGGEKPLELPLWSVAENKYVMRDVKDRKWVAANRGKPLKGVVLDIDTGDVVADVHGGKDTRNLNGRKVEDYAAAETLVVHADGQLEVLGSVEGEQDASRKRREKQWQDWVKEVEKTSGPSGIGGGGLFDRSGDGGP